MKLIHLAYNCGVGKTLVACSLAVGARNSIGCTCAIAGDHVRALQQVDSSLVAGIPDSEIRLLAAVRVDLQLQPIGRLPPQGGTISTEVLPC